MVGTAIVQKSRFSGSDAICVCVLSYARRTRRLLPKGKNTVAHDTSLDRYPVWRIRSFIGIDMFAVAWSFTLVELIFIRSIFIMRSECYGIFSRQVFKFDKFSIANKCSRKIYVLQEKMVGTRDESDFSNTHVQNDCSPQSTSRR